MESKSNGNRSNKNSLSLLCWIFFPMNEFIYDFLPFDLRILHHSIIRKCILSNTFRSVLKKLKQIIKIHAQTLFKSTFSLIRVKMSPTIPFYSPPTLTSLFFLLTNSILSCSAFCGSECGAQWGWSFSEVAFLFKFIQNFTICFETIE